MTLDSNWFLIAVLIAVVLAGALIFLFLKQRRQMKALERSGGTASSAHPPASPGHSPATGGSSPVGDPAGTRQLQLAAYERLILLTDRIALPNLIQRVNQPGLSAREMQSLLSHAIRQEFEHNITQQIYVTPEAWDAVRNYKEQNLLIINQIGSFLPEEATGADLNRHLLDLLVQNPQASLQNIVSEALSYEAKKLL